MKTLKYFSILLATVLFAGQALALSGVPSLVDSDAHMLYPTGEILTLLVVPDGSGPAFTDAVNPAGVQVDATIELFLCDELVVPIPQYPWEDIWLDFSDATGGLAICNPRSSGHVFRLINLDDNTNSQGMAYISQPQYGGGHLEGPIYMKINDSRLIGRPALPIRFNSPDITGDSSVDLSDVVPFAQDFYGAYHFRSDLAHDGVINLSDVAVMAEHLGKSCP